MDGIETNDIEQIKDGVTNLFSGLYAKNCKEKSFINNLFTMD